MDWRDVPRIPMQISRGIVVASVQTDLTEPVLARFQEELLAFIHRHDAFGVVIDFSGIDIVDRTEFNALRKLLKMASLLGASPMLAGLGPGMVYSLIDSGADIEGIEGALLVDDALTRIREAHSASVEPAAAAEQPVEETLELRNSADGSVDNMLEQQGNGSGRH